MVDIFSLSTAHLFDDALAQQSRLRWRVFVENRKLEHLHYRGLEYDEFDTPAAVYLVWRDDEGIARGLIRLLPTTLPYMLQKYWPHLVETGEIPVAEDIWEITRVCVDKSFDPAQRRRILPELLCGIHEFFSENGIGAMIGVTRPHLVNHFIRSGVTWLGQPAMVEGEMEAAFIVPTPHIRPDFHCQKYGITGPVLNYGDAASEKRAA